MRSLFNQLPLRIWAALSMIMAMINSSYGQSNPESFVHISYTGSYITRPGLQLGWEKPLKQKNRNMNGSSANWLWSTHANLGFYIHPKYQTGLFLTHAYSLKRISKKGNFLSSMIGLGYLMTDVPQVWEYTPNGGFSRSRATNHHFLTMVALGIGKYRPEKRWNWFIQPNLWIYTPQFPRLGMNLLLQGGIFFHLPALKKK